MINLDNVDRPAILAEVTAAFYQYEEALVSNNIEALDALFWHDPRTVRLGAGENLYGMHRVHPRGQRPPGPPAADLGTLPLRLADCRRPGQSDGLSGVYGSGPETKVSTGPLPVR